MEISPKQKGIAMVAAQNVIGSGIAMLFAYQKLPYLLDRVYHAPSTEDRLGAGLAIAAGYIAMGANIYFAPKIAGKFFPDQNLN